MQSASFKRKESEVKKKESSLEFVRTYVKNRSSIP